MRGRIVCELIQTETKFVSYIDKTLEDFFKPLQKLSAEDGDLNISNADLDVIFSNVAAISILNKKFLETLCLADHDKIGQLFLEYGHFFKMYGMYAGQHSVAVNRLRRLRQDNSKVEQTFATLEQQSGDSLESLLIMPVQRIPRYEMLLRELVKYTDNALPDFPNLEKALTLVHQVATHMNEMIKAYEKSEELRTLEGQFVSRPNFVEPGRELVRQGTLIKRCRKRDQEYTFFLFNNLIAYASRKSSLATQGKYKLHRRIDIDARFSVEEFEEPNLYGFTLVSASKSFVVFSTSQEEQQSWINSIKQCITRSQNTHKHKKVLDGTEVAPVWKPDQSVDKCPYCQIKFNIIVRRHHCRKCGNIACGNCSSHRVVLPPNPMPQRVCDVCAEAAGISVTGEKENEHQGTNALGGVTSKTVPNFVAFTLPKKFHMKFNWSSANTEDMALLRSSATDDLLGETGGRKGSAGATNVKTAQVGKPIMHVNLDDTAVVRTQHTLSPSFSRSKQARPSHPCRSPPQLPASASSTPKFSTSSSSSFASTLPVHSSPATQNYIPNHLKYVCLKDIATPSSVLPTGPRQFSSPGEKYGCSTPRTPFGSPSLVLPTETNLTFQERFDDLAALMGSPSTKRVAGGGFLSIADAAKRSTITKKNMFYTLPKRFAFKSQKSSPAPEGVENEHDVRIIADDDGAEAPASLTPTTSKVLMLHMRQSESSEPPFEHQAFSPGQLASSHGAVLGEPPIQTRGRKNTISSMIADLRPDEAAAVAV